MVTTSCIRRNSGYAFRVFFDASCRETIAHKRLTPCRWPITFQNKVNRPYPKTSKPNLRYPSDRGTSGLLLDPEFERAFDILKGPSPSGEVPYPQPFFPLIDNMVHSWVQDFDTPLYKGKVTVKTGLFINNEWVDATENSRIE